MRESSILRGGRNKSKLDRENESNRTTYMTKSNILERRVRQKGTGWSQSRKKTGWTEQKKRVGREEGEIIY